MPTTAPSAAARKQAATTEKATVIPTGAGGIPLTRLPPLAAELTRVLISDLFPALLKKQTISASKSIDTQVVWSLKCPDLEADVARGVYQAFAQTRRRSERLPIETAEFAQAEKSRHAEQIRRTYRSGTRFNQSAPARKRPLSTLLAPPATSEIKLLRPLVWTINGNGSHPPSLAYRARNSGPGGFPFPGSVPCSLLREDIIQSLYNPANYWAYAPKTNGLRFLLVGCTLHGEQFLLLVNRAQQTFRVRMKAPEALFDGTILDCELVPLKDGRYSLIVFDSIMVCGVSTAEHNYLVRLQNGADLVEAWSCELNPASRSEEHGEVPRTKALEVWYPDAPFSVRVKHVYAGAQMPDVLASVIPYLDHEVDGLISTQIESCAQTGQTRTIFKIKRGADNTIDFVFQAINVDASQNWKGEGELLCLQGEHRWRVWSRILIFPDEVNARTVADRLGLDLSNKGGEGSEELTELQARSRALILLTGQIVECRFLASPSDSSISSASHAPSSQTPLSASVQTAPSDSTSKMCDEPDHMPKPDLTAKTPIMEGTWHIEALRADKTAPNRLSTCEFTWRNIQENLGMLDIFPEGSIPAEGRERLRKWELEHKNLHWQHLSTTGGPKVIPPPLAPVSVNYLSRF
jgi:hypothetical protein